MYYSTSIFSPACYFFTNRGKKGEGENVESYNIFPWNCHISGLHSQASLADPNSLGSGREEGQGRGN